MTDGKAQSENGRRIETAQVKRLGLMGGFSAYAGTHFYLQLVEAYAKRVQQYPAILMDTAPVSRVIENRLVGQALSQDWQSAADLVRDSALSLIAAGCDLIALPCNTVSARCLGTVGDMGVPLIGPIVPSAEAVGQLSAKSSVVLGTRPLLASGAYARALSDQGSRCVETPDPVQDCVDRLIQDSVMGKARSPRLVQFINDWLLEGAHACVIACTDLYWLGSELSSSVIIVDSLSALRDDLIARMTTGDYASTS